MSPLRKHVLEAWGRFWRFIEPAVLRSQAWLTPQEQPVSAFTPALIRIQTEAPSPRGRQVLRFLLLMLAALIIGSLVGRLDIVAVAEGKLVPQTYLKVVQPAEAGIVKEILVSEGDVVKTGQVLMRMDMLATEADGKSLEAEFQRKRLLLRRIDAELNGSAFLIQDGDPPALAKEIQAQYLANRRALEAALAEERTRLTKAQQDLQAAEQVKAKLQAVLPHYIEQDKAYEKLMKEGFAGSLMGSDKRRERVEKEQELKTQVHVLESARSSISQSEKKLIQIESDYKRQLHAERNEAQGAVDKLTQELAKQAHRQELLELKASQDSVVKDLATHTVGTVVQPATVLLTLVPINEPLRAEVRVSNEDIGFVRPGQTVKIKLMAYTFQKYGMVEGEVMHVSADSAESATATAEDQASKEAKPAALTYKALIKLKQTALRVDGEEFPLSSGMQTSAEILLGTRSVLEYLLSPVQKAWHEAGRER